MTDKERKELAELLFPNIKHDRDYYENEPYKPFRVKALKDSRTGIVKIDICKLFNNTCRTSIEYNQEFDVWTCYSSMRIVPDLQKVISIENDLFQIAIKNNCSYEGFGSFGN